MMSITDNAMNKELYSQAEKQSIFLCLLCGKTYSNPIKKCENGCTCSSDYTFDNYVDMRRYSRNPMDYSVEEPVEEKKEILTHCNATIIEIDKGLESLILKMWKCGLKMRWSCSGHRISYLPNECEFDEPYFVIEFNKEFLEILIRRINADELLISNILIEIETLYGCYDSPMSIVVRDSILYNYKLYPWVFWKVINELVDWYIEFKTSTSINITEFTISKIHNLVSE